MINRFKYKDTVWVDLSQPSQSEIDAVMNEFGISPAIANELSLPSVKSRVELHQKHLYLILHFPVFKHSHSGEHRQEVDFIIGDKFLLTVRYDTVDSIEKFQKLVEVKSILGHGTDEGTPGALFFAIISEIYHSLFDELDYVETWISKIELDIFSGKEREMVFALSDVSRTLLNFKKAIGFHREMLKNLEGFGKKIFGEGFSYHVTQALAEYTKLENNLHDVSTSVTELRETNNSLVSTKQNEIMKTLTIFASIAFPMTIIAAAFGISSTNIPFIGDPNDFWIVVSIMVTAALVMLLYFTHKKWL